LCLRAALFLLSDAGVVSAVAGFPSASSSIHGGCLELCFLGAGGVFSRSSSPAAWGGLLRSPPSGLYGCRAPALQLQSCTGFYCAALPQVALIPGGGVAAVCAASPSATRWTPEGPDRVLRFLRGPFCTFAGLCCISPLFEGLPCNCTPTWIY
jgi:hypothetical protein